jgi:hypothetical protein
MVKNKRGSVLGWLALSVLLAAPSSLEASDTVYEAGKNVEVLGTTMGAKVNTSTTATNQVASTVSLNSLGTAIQALFALTNPPNTIDGTTYTEVYSFGKRVFSGASYSTSNGGQISVGLAPTQVRVPFVMYPIGPVTLEVDGGARFQANLSMNNMTNISIPIQYSEPGLQLSAAAGAAGFVEGYAKLFVVRGGAGGQLDLVDAHLDVNTKYNIEENKVSVTVAGIAEFLKGRIYAFVDIWGIFSWGWKRLIDKDLYNWNGYCFATENMACPGK